MTAAVAAYIQQCQTRLNRLLEHQPAMGRSDGAAVPDALLGLGEASHYSLANGGKRVRPVLVYAAAEATGNPLPNSGLDHAALAVELVHTYSLIHDDLPALDDDDLRRGKPSQHRAYDDATAILVGDGLQARAFERLTAAPDPDPGQIVAMVTSLAGAAGPRGMVGGQFIDIRAIDSDMDLPRLVAMHSLKTGALIRASLVLGGVAGRASDSQLAALDDFGRHIGLAFQVVDDILDVEGDSATLGKTGGKDSAANKPTYVRLLGLDGARKEARRLLGEGLDSLGEFGDAARHLRELARYIVERDR